MDRLRGALLTTSLAGFAISFGLAFAAALALHAVGLIKTPLLVAIVFVATSLSIIIVPLKDAHETDTDWGQQVIAAAAVAEFGAVILLSFFYSGQRSGPGTEIFHLSLFLVLAALLLFSLTHGAQFKRVTDAINRLEGTSAQIGVRGDFALIAVVAGVATQLGLETILAAFTVGVIRGMTSTRDELQEERLDAVTLGIFIPFFFVDSGLQFDLGALFSSVSSFIRLPLFLVAILAGQGAAGPHLPIPFRYASHGRRRPTSGHLAVVHRRRDADRADAQHHVPGHRDRARRRRPDHGDGLPGDRVRADRGAGGRSGG